MGIQFAAPTAEPKRAAKSKSSKSKVTAAVDTRAADTIPSLAELRKLPVFGPADVFPMLADDDLEDLANDIAANGLREPIVIGRITAKGETEEEDKTVLMLIDGRNRLAACVKAKVEPTVRYLADDPTAYVLSANINRRHMTKGQRAMAVAMIYPGGSGNGANPNNLGLSGELLRQARMVLSYSLPLAQSVMTGKPIAEAFSEAKAKLAEQQTEEDRQQSEKAAFEADIAKLRARYPELARRVIEDGLSLRAMLVEADEKDAAAKSQRNSLFTGLRNARSSMVGFAASTELPKLPEYLKSKEFKKEFVETFRDEPAALVAMVASMESELAALKTIVAQIEEA